MSLDRTCAEDLDRRTLAAIPSHFGRLVYLGSLVDWAAGAVYIHDGLELCWPGQAEDTLRRAHRREFASWLNLTLEEQAADLRVFLSPVAHRERVLAAWRRRPPWPGVAPAGATHAERRLWTAHMDALVELLSHDQATR